MNRVSYGASALIELGVAYPVRSSFSTTQRICGIYIIQNIFSDRCYMGASVDVASRWVDHRNGLVKGQHGVKDLLADFKANPENFIFKLIEICDAQELPWREFSNSREHQIQSPEWGYSNTFKKYIIR